MSDPSTPPQAIILQMLTGAWVAQALGAVARLGVADELASGPRTTAELARAVGANPDALGRVLRALAGAGLFTVPATGSWALTPLGECLRTGVPGSMRHAAIAETDHAHWATWGLFVQSLRTGAPQTRAALGCEPWDYYRDHPEDGAVFSQAMANYSSLSIAPILASYDFTNVGVVADIGGAYGALLAAILRTQPRARGILFDRPDVVRGADAVLGDVGARVERIGGDFLNQPAPAADLYLLKHILHDWDDAASRTILQNVRAGMRAGARVLVIEMVVDEQPGPGAAPWMDLNMMVALGGRERTASEYERLLASAGLGVTRVIATPSPFGIVEAVTR